MGRDNVPPGRPIKQSRRQRKGGGRGQRDGMMGFNGMPTFDPSNPMETLMQMQALGLFSGMPDPSAWGNTTGRAGRCLDFDEKGFCSRGSTCPYDHGFMPGMDINNDGKLLATFSSSMARSFTKLMLTIIPDYDTNNTDMNMSNGINQMNPFAFVPNANSPKRSQRKGKSARKGGTRSALSAEGPVQDHSRSTLVVENIPEESFSEKMVQGYFEQFGEITDISMQPYKHLAIVKYDNWNSANAAYRSPKAIFDNRFVKVFWYKEPGDAIPQSMPLNSSSKHRPDHELEEGEQPEDEEFDMEEFTNRQEKAQKLYLEREAKRSELEKLREELDKDQQDLLARHKEETDKLQVRLAEKNGGGTASGTDMLRAKLAQLEQEAKMLGIDPNAADDASSTTSYNTRGGYRGRGGSSFRGRGFAPQRRGAFRGQEGRHAAYAQYTLDNRPKQLAVTGADFTQGEKDELLRHFLLNLGEFESVETSPEVTHVSFQDRKTAERFYYSLQGKELPGVEGKLELAWVNTPAAPVGVVVKREDGAAANGDGGGAMADEDGDEGMGETLREGSEEGEVEEEPQRETRVFNMDYEVADDEPWDQ